MLRSNLFMLCFSFTVLFSSTAFAGQFFLKVFRRLEVIILHAEKWLGECADDIAKSSPVKAIKDFFSDKDNSAPLTNKNSPGDLFPGKSNPEPPVNGSDHKLIEEPMKYGIENKDYLEKKLDTLSRIPKFIPEWLGHTYQKSDSFFRGSAAVLLEHLKYFGTGVESSVPEPGMPSYCIEHSAPLRYIDTVNCINCKLFPGDANIPRF